MSEKFWMVCGSFNSPKYRHNSLDSATNEAERLAKLHPGEKFFVLEAVGVAQQTNNTYRKL